MAALLAGCPGPTTGGSASAANPPAPTPDPWKRATAAAPFGKISFHTSLAFAPAGQTEPLLWVIGGIVNNTRQDKVWSSADGIAWTEAPKSAETAKRFSARHGHTSLVFTDPTDNKQKMWVLGGYDGSDKHDVWSSEDGKDWNQATAAAGWSARVRHTSLVFKDPTDNKQKMWVLGGFADTKKNDVWSSENGKTWTEVTAAAGWSARWLHASLVFNNKLWVLGGYDGSFKNDVWSSDNGKDWQQEPTATWSARGYHSSLVFSDPADNIQKMWVLGGDSGGNEVWRSADGHSWSKDQLVNWPTRYNHSSAVFKQTVWVIGGAGGGSGSGSDVWYYSPPAGAATTGQQ